MNARRTVGAIAVFGVAGASAVGLSIGGAAAPAEAFTGTCPTTVPAAILVADGVCEVRITATGAFSFTPPSGITKLAAVLVGGGGGGEIVPIDTSYAGNGGSVTYVDSVPLGGPVAGIVGLGGLASQDSTVVAPDDGSDTVAGADTAAGGGAGFNAEPFCASPPNLYGFGSGANAGPQGSAQGDPVCLPGVGYSLSQLSGVDTTLFPASADGTDVYGNGGNASATDPGLVSLVAGSGGSVNATQAASGSNGLVIFRFAPAPVAPPAPTLAATGSDVSWTVPGISAALIAVGALLLALRRRRPAQR